jgi:tripartite-type tricarboxylate transporter receptor subunit TctC
MARSRFLTFASSIWRTIPLATMAALLVVLVASDAHTQADNYPNKTIKILVGPSPDVVPRVIGQYLQEAWGASVVVEPRPGAGGALAANAVSSAEPDGHTFLFSTPSYTLNTAMKTAPYDLLKEFAPVSLISTAAYTLVVHPSVPVNNFAELVALARAKPGTLNCASAGIGTAPHLACETLNTIPGVNVVHIPYRNVNEAMNGIVAGHVQVFMSVSLVAKQQMLSNTVRAIATTGPKRSTFMPELPTVVEAGYPNFVLTGWNGLITAAATPKPIRDKINAQIARALDVPAVREKLAATGSEFMPTPLTVDEFGTFIKNDIARWSALVNAVGIEKFKAR